MRFALFLLFAVFLTVFAVASPDRHVLYTRTSAPTGWRQLSEAPAAAPVQFMIALRQNNADYLERRLLEVSDPTHPDYQKFMTIDEIHALSNPGEETRAKVLQWLNQHGVKADSIKDYTDALEVAVPASKASKLFDTPFYVYESTESGKKIVRNHGDFSIPAELKDQIDFVEGISSFPIPHYKAYVNKQGMQTIQDRKQSPAAAERRLLQDPVITMQNEGIVYFSIFNIYNVGLNQQAFSQLGTSMGVIEFQEQYYSPDDLSEFGSQLLEGMNATVLVTVGPNNPKDSAAQIEADLDVQAIMTTNIEAKPWFWLEEGNGWLYQFATHFMNTNRVPQVVSLSYGWWEGDQCDVNPGGECSHLGANSTAYVLRTNTEFAKIGLRGVSIVVASGDSGAVGRSNDNCTIHQLRPAYPATSPYVLSVGATEVADPESPMIPNDDICNGAYFMCVTGGNEIAVDYDTASFTSGGGFSNITMRPSWQQAAVQNYLTTQSKALPPTGWAWNQQGRAVPDVAAFGYNFLMCDSVVSEDPFGIGGTSVASPIVAGMVALLNQESIKLSGKPLGFVNPLLYQAFAAGPTKYFNDITQGDNKCSDNGCKKGCQGFVAAAGWDPVTGLGSFNWNNLNSYVKQIHEERQTKFGNKN